MAEQKFLPSAWHFEIKDKIVSNIYLDIWAQFFGNETSKCSHWREKGPKGRGFSHPISSKITLGKERKAKIERARRKKGGKEEKNNGWSPSFYLLATFDIGFWLKKKSLTEEFYLVVACSKILFYCSDVTIVCSQTLYFLFKVQRAWQKNAGDLLTTSARGYGWGKKKIDLGPVYMEWWTPV